MTADMRDGQGRSIAVSILLLVVTALAAATAVLFAVTFNGPPPKPAPTRYAAIKQALRSGRVAGGPDRPLHVHDSAMPPVRRLGDRSSPQAAARIATLLAAAPGDVVALLPENGGGALDEVRGAFQVGWRHAGRWRIAETARERTFTRWHAVTLTAMLIVLALLSTLAWFSARAISKPLRQVADAALAARAGTPLGTLPPDGAAEIRDIARAVATMHDRLQRHAEGRTAMLGAIAHDLGTPLTRLAFWVEQLPETARLRAAADIEEMRAMIGATLAFARDDTTHGEQVRVDLGSVLDSLVEDMAMTGAAVMLGAGPRAVVRGDPHELRRLFANLVDNALRYGGAAALAWSVTGDVATVTVDDSGPGLGGAEAERLFEPFVRGDPSRNRATGGTGLGLAIVRTIVARHGGTAMLTDRPAGGARASVTLPLA